MEMPYGDILALGNGGNPRSSIPHCPLAERNFFRAKLEPLARSDSMDVFSRQTGWFRKPAERPVDRHCVEVIVPDSFDRYGMALQRLQRVRGQTGRLQPRWRVAPLLLVG